MGCSQDLSLLPAGLPRGSRNLISDVPGVRVGHTTIWHGGINTGVTAILPHGGNLFLQKVPAGHTVINGFGKSTGLVQLGELGTIETPILLTNTLSVGTAWNALLRYMLAENPDIGVETGTVNPIVCECNDGFLNDIRGMHVAEEDALAAMDCAGETFAEGGVGAGCGMVCYGLKGGIGSASRRAGIAGRQYTVGCLVLTNYGARQDFRLRGRPLFPQPEKAEPDKGSAIVILATDAPLDGRQLNRLSRRAVAGLARSGSVIGGGSGEIVLSFSTAYPVPHYPGEIVLRHEVLHEEYMDPLFRAAVESVEDAVLSSMLHAEGVTGFMGHRAEALSAYL